MILKGRFLITLGNIQCTVQTEEKNQRELDPKYHPLLVLQFKAPPNKKLNFTMPPKPKILRSTPELDSRGDDLLRQLHANHFYEAVEKFPPAETPTSKQFQLLNDIHAKTHEDIEEAVVTFFRDSITHFSKGHLDWYGHIGSTEWSEALKVTLEAVRDIIKKES